MAVVYFNNAISQSASNAGNYWNTMPTSPTDNTKTPHGSTPSWSGDTVIVIVGATMAMVTTYPSGANLTLSGGSIVVYGTLKTYCGTLTVSSGGLYIYGTLQTTGASCMALTVSAGGTVTFFDGCIAFVGNVNIDPAATISVNAKASLQFGNGTTNVTALCKEPYASDLLYNTGYGRVQGAYHEADPYGVLCLSNGGSYYGVNLSTYGYATIPDTNYVLTTAPSYGYGGNSIDGNYVPPVQADVLRAADGGTAYGAGGGVYGTLVRASGGGASFLIFGP